MVAFPTYDLGSSPDRSRSALSAAKKRAGFVINLIGIKAGSPALILGYSALARIFETGTQFSPLERQIVRLTAAVLHGAEFCVAAHTWVCTRMNLPSSSIEALRQNRVLDNPQHQALREFTTLLLRNRGLITAGDAKKFQDAGYEKTQMLDVLVGIAGEIVSIYTERLSAPDLNTEFEEFAWRAPHNFADLPTVTATSPIPSLNFQIHTADTAPSPADKSLAKIDKKLGFVPNMFAMHAGSPTLLEAYQTLSMMLETNISLSATEKQTSMITTSYEHECTYCVAAHSFFSVHERVPENVLEALRNDHPMPNPGLEVLRTTMRAIVRKRGQLNARDLELFFDAGFTSQMLLDYIGCLGLKVLSNYGNHLLDPPVDTKFAQYTWSRNAKNTVAVTD